MEDTQTYKSEEMSGRKMVWYLIMLIVAGVVALYYEDRNTGVTVALVMLCYMGVAISGIDSDPESSETIRKWCTKAGVFFIPVSFVSAMIFAVRALVNS